MQKKQTLLGGKEPLKEKEKTSSFYEGGIFVINELLTKYSSDIESIDKSSVMVFTRGFVSGIITMLILLLIISLIS